MTLGHFGLAITIAGITGAGAWKVESIQTMEPGEKVNVAGYILLFWAATLEMARIINLSEANSKFTRAIL